MKTAYFAAGCFWGIEKKFSEIPGVVKTAAGYMGGDYSNPTYEQVCSGETGHAETVEVIYDPERVTYPELLERFWGMHNPTSLNYQGWDVGTQYRTAIFTADEEQLRIATQSREDESRSGRHSSPIVTEVTTATHFWPAEEYHQQYLSKKQAR